MPFPFLFFFSPVFVCLLGLARVGPRQVRNSPVLGGDLPHQTYGGLFFFFGETPLRPHSLIPPGGPAQPSGPCSTRPFGRHADSFRMDPAFHSEVPPPFSRPDSPLSPPQCPSSCRCYLFFPLQLVVDLISSSRLFPPSVEVALLR